MKSKKIEHERMQKCLLSGEKIDTELNDYIIVTTCHGDKIDEVKFYKRKYFESLFSESKKEVSEAIKGRIMDTAFGMLSKLGLNVSN